MAKTSIPKWKVPKGIKVPKAPDVKIKVSTEPKIPNLGSADKFRPSVTTLERDFSPKSKK